MTSRAWLLVMLALPLGFWWRPTERDYLRAAESAYRQGKYEEALRHYQAAALITRDPGFVAFNQAAMLSRLRRWPEAIQGYTQALEDAHGNRRLLSLYGRGTARLALALEPGTVNRAELLADAIEDFRTCLSEQPDFENAQVHLGLAMQLLAHLQKESQPAKAPDHTHKSSARDNESRPPDKSQSDKPQPKPVKEPLTEKAPNKPIETSDWIRPGRGQLPAIPKTVTAPPLSAQDAQRWIDHEWQRITQARALRSVSLPQGIDIRDW